MARDVRLIRSSVSLAGMVLTTISAVLFLIVFLADLFGLHTNPYIGILFFVVLPALFLVGLVLIPAGAWMERRRRDAGLPPSEISWPRFDLNDSVTRQRAVFGFALTMANVIIVSLAAYRGVAYMDSPEFCGQVCHTVMQPEYTSRQTSPHAKVACVECHIGAGAGEFAKAKLSGTRQLVAVAMNNYPRPIPHRVQTMRPARETCETCHWSEQFHGDVARRVAEYADDEKNTESVTNLLVHVGGGSDRLGIATGIHWHMNVENEIEYVATDGERQVIPYVRLKDRTGAVREYTVDGVTPEQLAKGERRRMDCMDCHNRPTHTLSGTPERAVNAAMAIDQIPRALPFAHREVVTALKVSYPTQAAGLEGISRAVRDFYRTQYPDTFAGRRPDVEKAAATAARIYQRNVFPEMNVKFGTYPNNIGHIDFPGCFRCHDDNHKTGDGRKIGQECDSCHDIR